LFGHPEERNEGGTGIKKASTIVSIGMTSMQAFRRSQPSVNLLPMTKEKKNPMRSSFRQAEEGESAKELKRAIKQIVAEEFKQFVSGEFKQIIDDKFDDMIRHFDKGFQTSLTALLYKIQLSLRTICSQPFLESSIRHL